MAERPRYRDFAHQKTPKDIAPPNWATCPGGVYFAGGKVNRETHADFDGAEASVSSMGRTVRVEHHHFKSKDSE